MRIIVRYNNGANYWEILQDYPNLSNLKHLEYLYTFIFSIDVEEEEDLNLITQLKADSRIKRVNADDIVVATGTTESTTNADPVGYYYHLEDMNKRDPTTEQANSNDDHQYSYSQDGSEVDIYILDSGVNFNHPYLKSNNGSNTFTTRVQSLPGDLYGKTGITGLYIATGGAAYYSSGLTVNFPDPETETSIADTNIPSADRRSAQAFASLSGGANGSVIKITIVDFGYGYDVTKMAEISNLITVTDSVLHTLPVDPAYSYADIEVTSMGNMEDETIGSGHGTQMALISAGWNSYTSPTDFGPGVAKKANVWSVKCLDHQAQGTKELVLDGINAIIKHNSKKKLNPSNPTEAISNPDYKGDTVSSTLCGGTFCPRPSIINVSFSHLKPNSDRPDYYIDISGTRSDDLDVINDALKLATNPDPSPAIDTETSAVHVVLGAGNGYNDGTIPQANATIHGPMDAKLNLASISIAGLTTDLGQGNPIAVGSTKEATSSGIDTWENSNYGEAITLWTPGQEIISPSWVLEGDPSTSFNNNQYDSFSGTSYSAAIVTGLLALRLQDKILEAPSDTKTWLTSDATTSDKISNLMQEVSLPLPPNTNGPLRVVTEGSEIIVTWTGHPLSSGDKIQISGLFGLGTTGLQYNDIAGWRDIFNVTANEFRFNHEATPTSQPPFPTGDVFGGSDVKISIVDDTHEFNDGVVANGDATSIKQIDNFGTETTLNYLPVSFSTKSFIFNPYQEYITTWQQSNAALGSHPTQTGFSIDLSANMNTITEPNGHAGSSIGPFPITYSYTGSLPYNTSLDSATGELSGDLENAQSSLSFTIEADNGYVIATQTYTMSVFLCDEPTSAFTINSAAQPNLISGDCNYFTSADDSGDYGYGVDTDVGCNTDHLLTKVSLSLDDFQTPLNCDYVWKWYVDDSNGYKLAAEYQGNYPPANICLMLQETDLSDRDDLEDCGMIHCYTIKLEIERTTGELVDDGTSDTQTIEVDMTGGFTVEYTGTDYDNVDKCSVGCGSEEGQCGLVITSSSTVPGYTTPTDTGDTNDSCNSPDYTVNNPVELLWVYVLQTYASDTTGRYRAYYAGVGTEPDAYNTTNICFPDVNTGTWTDPKKEIILLGLDPCHKADLISSIDIENNTNTHCNDRLSSAFFLGGKINFPGIGDGDWKVYSACTWLDDASSGYDAFGADGCANQCTAVLTIPPAATLSLIHFNGPYDSTNLNPENIAFSLEETIISPTGKFNTNSALFNGSSSYVDIPAITPAFELDGDFTIDFWANFDNLSTQQTLFSSCELDDTTGSYTSTGVGLELLWPIDGNDNNEFILRIQNVGVITNTDFPIPEAYVSKLAINRFFHIAIVRNANIISLYINGIPSTATLSNSDTFDHGFTGKIYIGKSQSIQTNRFKGFIDEFRIVKGHPLWTQNFSILSTNCHAVPAVEFTGCTPDDIDQTPCGKNNSGLKERTCLQDGTWGDYDSCEGEDECTYGEIRYLDDDPSLSCANNQQVQVCPDESGVDNSANAGYWHTGGYLIGPDTFFEGFLIAGSSAAQDTDVKIGYPRLDASEDPLNTYQDGLVKSWTYNTPVGHAIDDINEELKTMDDNVAAFMAALSPGPTYFANQIDRISSYVGDNNNNWYSNHWGLTVRISESPNPAWVSGTPAGGDEISGTVSLFLPNTGEFSAVDTIGGYFSSSLNYYSGSNHVYSEAPTSSEYDRRLGAYYGDPTEDNSPRFKFQINTNVNSNSPNYNAGSFNLDSPFSEGTQGTIKLQLNNSDPAISLISIDLSLAGNKGNITVVGGSGTEGKESSMTIGPETSAHFDNNTPVDVYKHRAGPHYIEINSKDMRLGWNWARIVHDIEGRNIYSNYVSWVLDDHIGPAPSLSDINATVNTQDYPYVDEGDQTTEQWLSGVKYLNAHAQTPNVIIKTSFTIDDAYKNFYSYSTAIHYSYSQASSTGGILFPTSWGSYGANSENLPLPSGVGYAVENKIASFNLSWSSNCHDSSKFITGWAPWAKVKITHPFDSNNAGPNAPWGPTNPADPWVAHNYAYILGDPDDAATQIGTFLAARTDCRTNINQTYSSETEIEENFITEVYRLTDHVDRTTGSCAPIPGSEDEANYPSNCYKLQSDVITELAAGWNKEQDLDADEPGYKGLMCFLTSLRSPKMTNDTDRTATFSLSPGVVDGNFNAIDYPSGTNADYSGITTTEARWFYRAFNNNSGESKQTFKVKITGSNISSSYTGNTTQIVPATSTAGVNTLSGNNIFVEIRIPEMHEGLGGVANSGWLDLAIDRTGYIQDGGGLLAEGSGYGSGSNHILSGEKTFNCSIGTRYILAGDWIVLRVKTLSSWNKKIDTIEIVW